MGPRIPWAYVEVCDMERRWRKLLTFRSWPGLFLGEEAFSGGSISKHIWRILENIHTTLWLQEWMQRFGAFVSQRLGGRPMTVNWTMLVFGLVWLSIVVWGNKIIPWARSESKIAKSVADNSVSRGIGNIQCGPPCIEPPKASDRELKKISQAVFIRFKNESRFTENTYTVDINSVMADAEIYDYKSDNPVRTISKCFWSESDDCFINFPVDFPRRIAIAGITSAGKLVFLEDERSKTGNISKIELPLGSYKIMLTLRVGDQYVTYTEGPFEFELTAASPDVITIKRITQLG